MNANELRIRNWVNWQGRYIDISEICYFIDIDDDRQGYSNDGAWIEDCEGIPLTPEILEKAGFEIKDNNDYYVFYVFSDFVLKYHIDGSHSWVSYDGGGHVQIRYLHQLQNLYFALTGEELDIQL